MRDLCISITIRAWDTQVLGSHVTLTIDISSRRLLNYFYSNWLIGFVIDLFIAIFKLGLIAKIFLDISGKDKDRIILIYRVIEIFSSIFATMFCKLFLLIRILLLCSCFWFCLIYYFLLYNKRGILSLLHWYDFYWRLVVEMGRWPCS